MTQTNISHSYIRPAGHVSSLRHALGVAAFALFGMACTAPTGEGGAPAPERETSFGEKYANVDPETLTEDEKFQLVVDWMGLDDTDMRVVPEGRVVEDDILILTSDLDGYVSRIFNPDKAYLCAYESGSTSPGTADGRPCNITSSDVPEDVDSIYLDIDPSLPAGWKLAFRRAAAAWSSTKYGDTQIGISMDAEGKRANASRWTIVIDPGTYSTLHPATALASSPSYVPIGGGWVAMRPGSLVIVNTWTSYNQADMDHTALHELGHTLGFHHPGHGTWLQGTAINESGGSRYCDDRNLAGHYETAMCSGPGYGTHYLSEDDRLAASMLYPREEQFDVTFWDWSFCSASGPCDMGEGDCDSDAECKGFLICNTTSVAVNRYGAPYIAGGSSSGDVCTTPYSERDDGAVQCGGFNWDRCKDIDCPCGAGSGDCEPGECPGGLTCGTDNGPAFGQGQTYDLCVHPRPPGCAAYDRSVLDWSLCTPDCPCSFGEGDCDTDADCIGDLVCGQNVSGSFLGYSQSDVDLCVHPTALGNL